MRQPDAKYEDYSTTSRHYDASRVPVGVAVHLGIFASHPAKRIDQQMLLDAGCGTGSYLHEMAPKFRHATGLDANAGMLGQAKAKMGSAANVNFHQAELPGLPFDDASFDAIMINQVVHHLDEGSNFPVLRRFIGEAYRALAPGGALVIHTSSRKQMKRAYWFERIIPRAMERMANRFAPIPLILEMLDDSGFEEPGMTAPLEAMFNLETYLNPEGPFDPAWRACDSTFALATEQELAEGLVWLRAACEDGSAKQTIDEAEDLRKMIGQSTFVSARKAA